MLDNNKLLPPRLFDAHMHFYNTVANTATTPFKVPVADVNSYQQKMAELNIEKVAVVQSMLYGTDNSVMLHGVEALGLKRACAIAVTKADAPKKLWQDLDKKGVRGLRAFMLFDPLLQWSELVELSKRLADIGWQLHLQMDGRKLPQYRDIISQIACPLVIDHVGKFIPPVKVHSDAFQTLLRLLENENRWVKISGFYETSKTGAPDYEDVTVLARTLVSHIPDRVVWASNWPHPNLQPPPDDLALIELTMRLTDTPEAAEKLFYSNAMRLYGFSKP